MITGEDKDMVRAINRVIGSEIEQRTFSSFDYGSPKPAGNKQPQKQWKPRRNFSAPKKGRSQRPNAARV